MYHMTHIRKRIRKLSTAVFRGSRSEYNFDVYPISTAITDHPVVFIFSRRKVDKKGNGHHAVSCVGETQSIISEIKKHKRARCVKGSEANVVCILREGDRVARSGVLDDITSARAFSCVRGKFKPTIKAKLNAVRNGKTAKILSFKPITNNSGRSVAVVASNNSVKGKPKSVKQGNIKETRKSAAKRKTTSSKTAKKGRASESRKRVSRDVDSDGGQHRLSDKKRPASGTAKARIACSSRSHTKLAA
jgi:hypothetical protein